MGLFNDAKHKELELWELKFLTGLSYFDWTKFFVRNQRAILQKMRNCKPDKWSSVTRNKNYSSQFNSNVTLRSPTFFRCIFTKAFGSSLGCDFSKFRLTERMKVVFF